MSDPPPAPDPVDLVITPQESVVLEQLRAARDEFNLLEPAATVEETVDFLAGLKQAQGIIAVRALKRVVPPAWL